MRDLLQLAMQDWNIDIADSLGVDVPVLRTHTYKDWRGLKTPRQKVYDAHCRTEWDDRFTKEDCPPYTTWEKKWVDGERVRVRVEVPGLFVAKMIRIVPKNYQELDRYSFTGFALDAPGRTPNECNEANMKLWKDRYLEVDSLTYPSTWKVYYTTTEVVSIIEEARQKGFTIYPYNPKQYKIKKEAKPCLIRPIIE
tara:strand:- start:616 stop:1203 length:588 start_codon:yes stop_codon:yes gene_type:complete